MRSVHFPGTDLDPSVICLGTGGYGSSIPRDQSFQLLDGFFERGGSFLDSAHVYAAWIPNGAGASERTIGEWQEDRGVRDRIIIGTKGGHPELDKMRVPRLSPPEIERDLFESLERLRTDRIDLYWLHRDDPATPVDVIMDALNRHI
ncbi:aldo/keto reductase, partial [bacterium]|nr:aldo/keto reductase [bacterium]